MPARRHHLRLPLVIIVGSALAACVGPSYHRPPMPSPDDWRAPSASADSLRPFFDSLARSRDTAAPPSHRALPDSATDPRWLALFQDTVLQRLVETAVRENRDVRVAAATIEEFRADYGVAQGAVFPQLTLSGQGGKQKIIFGGNQPFTFDVFTLVGNVSWELDFWGRLRRATQAARADLLEQKENQRAVVLSLVGSVAISYLQLRQLDLDLSIAERTLASRRQTLALAQRRYGQGLISELDVRQFEADVADPAARVADFQRQIAQLENQLSVLLGHTPAAIPRGRPLPDVLSGIAIPAGVPSELLDRRPDVRAAEQSLAAATARIGVAEGARLPRFTITGQYGSQANQFSRLLKSNTDIYQVFFGISLPLFTGGQLTNEVRAARARAEQARYRYEQTYLQALQEVETSLSALHSDRDQVIAQQVQVDALRRALRLATERYEGGISAYLDVLDAERNLFTAELALTQVQLRQGADAVQLYEALGGGWPADTGSTPRR